MKNQDVMNILESVAKEWAEEKSDVEKEAVVSYLNELCAKWMGGNWGLKVTHITTKGKK